MVKGIVKGKLKNSLLQMTKRHLPVLPGSASADKIVKFSQDLVEE